MSGLGRTRLPPAVASHEVLIWRGAVFRAGAGIPADRASLDRPSRLLKNSVLDWFWVAQRFQRCIKCFVLNDGFLAAEVIRNRAKQFFSSLLDHRNSLFGNRKILTAL